MTLCDLKPEHRARISGLSGPHALRQRFAALGILRGQPVSLHALTFWGSPRAYTIGQQQLCLRNKEACCIEVELQHE